MRLACLALVPLLVACGELDDIDAGVCGNGILEQGEDCDSSDPSCSPPGAELECRYVAVNGACPPGGAAVGKDVGGDEVCRFSTGEYQSSSFISAGANVLIGVADLDGDFALDPVAFQPGAVSVYFHDFEARLVATATVPAPLTFPTLGSLNAVSATAAPGSGASAIVFADNGVDVVLGQTGRTLQSKAYAPYPIDESVIDVVFAEVNLESPGQEVLAFKPDGANTSISDIYLQRTTPKVLANVNTNKLAPVAAGNVDELVDKYALDELVVAEVGKAELLLLKLWENPLDPVAKSKPIALPPGLKVASKPLLAYLNADEHLDVMLRGCADLQAQDTCRLLVGHGDGKGNFTAPETMAFNQLGAIFPNGAKLLNVNFPLAAGHLNADGILDFVTAPLQLGGADEVTIPARVLVSDPKATDSSCYGWDGKEFDNAVLGVTGYLCAAAGYWSQAIMGHLNGDGTPDVAATIAKSPIIDAMLGTPYGIFNSAMIGAQGEPTELLSGDFDGDLIPDLAFIEKGSEEETVAVAYGKPFGPPDKPVRLSGLGPISHLRAGYVAGYPYFYDAVTDLAFFSRDVATKERRAALLYGSTDRFFEAPFYVLSGLGEQQVFHPAVRAIVGDFAADGEGTGHGDLAVISAGDVSVTDTGPSLSKLWLLPSTGDGDLSNSVKKASDPLKDFWACAAAITPADLDGDGADQLVMLGLDAAGPALFVARQKPDAGFELGSRQPLQETYMDLLGALRCGGGAAGASGIDALALLLLARAPRAVDISGERGAEARPDIVAHVIPNEDQGLSPSALKVSVFPNDGAGNLDPAKRVLLDLPPELSDRFVISFDLLNADSDPQQEIAFVTMHAASEPSEFMFDAAYLADIDLEQGKMILKGMLPGSGKPVSVVTGDIDRDGVDDIVLSGLWGVEVLRGLPRAP